MIGCMLLAVLFVTFMSAHSSAAAGQSKVTLSYVVIGGGTPQPPILWYFFNGQNVTTHLTITPVTYKMDANTTWGVSRILPNSSFSYLRWKINDSSTGFAEGQTLVLFYYRQYYATFGVPAIKNIESLTLPQVNYTSLGEGYSITAGQSTWADYLSPYTYGDVNGTLPDTRWYVPAPTGLVENAALISPAYTEQYLLTFNLNSSGPNLLQSTTLMEAYGGSSTNRTLTAFGGSFWVDSKSSFAFPAAIYSGSGTNRWFLHPLSETIADAPATVTVSYYEQYPLSVSFTVSGGTAPSPPVLTSTSVGQEFSVQLFAGAPPTWVDAGSGYSISSLLLGSSSDERWLTEASTSGIASGPTTLDLDYFHQVQVAFSYSVAEGGSINPSNATFVSFGAQSFFPISTIQQSVWADFGTVLGFQGTFVGNSPLERWELGSAPSVVLTKPEVLSLVYFHQFHVMTSYSISGGGQPSSPTLAGFELGLLFTSPIQSGSLVWLDSGSFWNVPGVLQGGLSGERWAAVGVVNGTVGSRTSVGLTYQHEFYVALSANPPEGESLSGEGWVPAGESIQISASAARGLAFIGWVGSGQSSYSGRNQTSSVAVSGPVEETANYYVSLTIKVVGSGSVLVSYGSSSLSVGDELTIYVAPGTNITLNVKPGLLENFEGWVGIPAGNSGAVLITATAPVVANAVFGINEVMALGVVVLCFGGAAYVIAYLIWRGRASPAQLRNTLSHSVRAAG
jgi:hypothetical protein